jgi:HD-GYP domain-containing protein (c-di-GMP phosphodiesterase class II)
MRFKHPASPNIRSVLVVTAAFLLALASVTVVTTLQRRATSSDASQIALAQIAREFEALQNIPYDGIDAPSLAAQLDVLHRMQATERRIQHSLARLQDHSPTPHLHQVMDPYRSNTSTLEQIRLLVVRDRLDEANRLGPVADRLHGEADRHLTGAAVAYHARAASSLRLAYLGSGATVLVLVSLFGVFYLRSRRAHATAERLTHENAQLQVQDAHLQTIHRLALAGEYRDDETGQHTRRVGDLAARIGAALGMDDEQQRLLREAAPLHDVGKIAIPDSILLKPGRLTAEEFKQMEGHTIVGGRMLAGGRGIPLLEMAEAIALTHHERWDGSGYPAGLSGAAIPLVGRVVAVADVFDALTHSRPYKDAWPVADAVAEIRSQAGRQFDPDVVRAFTQVVCEAPVSVECRSSAPVAADDRHPTPQAGGV